MKQKRYVVSYIKYQHAELGSEDYEGWQSFYSSCVFDHKIEAIRFFNKLKQYRFYKNIFIAEELEVE